MVEYLNFTQILQGRISTTLCTRTCE